MNIKSIILWDKYSRLLHWSMALLMLFLSASAWLMGQLMDDIVFWAQWHSIAGQAMVILIMTRIALFFQSGNSHYSRLKVSVKDWPKIIEIIKFYISLGKAPLPAWLVINPFWRPLYIVFYVLLVLITFSGLVDANTLFLGFYWPSIHQSLAWWINLWMLLHVLAVFFHDWKSRVNRISAMISGVAYFETESYQPKANENVIQTDLLKPKINIQNK